MMVNYGASRNFDAKTYSSQEKHYQTRSTFNLKEKMLTTVKWYD